MRKIETSRLIVAVAAAALLAGSAGIARAGDSAQFSPNYNRILVNKQVGVEQWAITYDIATRDVLGNVFKTDGSPASFLSCSFQGEEDGTLSYECLGAEGCDFPAKEFCGGDQWSLIGDVEVDETFFFPAGIESLESPDEVCIDIKL